MAECSNSNLEISCNTILQDFLRYYPDWVATYNMHWTPYIYFIVPGILGAKYFYRKKINVSFSSSKSNFPNNLTHDPNPSKQSCICFGFSVYSKATVNDANIGLHIYSNSGLMWSSELT